MELTPYLLLWVGSLEDKQFSSFILVKVVVINNEINQLKMIGSEPNKNRCETEKIISLLIWKKINVIVQLFFLLPSV